MAAKNAKSDRPRDSMGRFRSKASEARSRAARRAPRDDGGRFSKRPKRNSSGTRRD